MHRALIAVSEANGFVSRCVHSQEPNVLELDGHTEEVLKVSRQVELFMSWLYVSKRMPSNWSIDRECAGKSSNTGT